MPDEIVPKNQRETLEEIERKYDVPIEVYVALAMGVFPISFCVEEKEYAAE